MATKKSVLDQAKDAVIGVTSDILSAPARYQASKTMQQAQQDFEDLRLVQKAKNAVLPDSANYTDPIFRARANVANRFPNFRPR